MAAISGFYERPEPPPSGGMLSNVLPHHDVIKTDSKVGTFCVVVLLIDALAAAVAIHSE